MISVTTRKDYFRVDLEVRKLGRNLISNIVPPLISDQRRLEGRELIVSQSLPAHLVPIFWEPVPIYREMYIKISNASTNTQLSAAVS